ncbi:hypothetical protein ACFOON_02935 [Novosphingobium piscinae]|uniref:Flagellar FliJ protein n=1 Tax=Novosphingobium piscinae TaxID=1507448 RepID=A0A7X1G0U2_9SPHN|nr:hypothetical protein [Novosphingobium piscinae]MBC2670486.1 hypothetical protein [Novosphingobium piscinae]
MPADRKRLARLQRLEKVRAIAKQTAAAEAAQAEGTLAQLLALADRTGQLESDYAARRDMTDGQALRLMTSFREGLAGVARSTVADAERARGIADTKLLKLSEAERRRQAVEDRARAEAKALASQGEQAPLTARKQLGTELE